MDATLATDSALLIARLLLAAVFAVAGVAKLANRAGSRQALVDFGVPAQLAGPLGILLPLAELATAVALVPTISAWWGAIAALALLVLFIGGIVANLVRGRRPDCHCFGQIASGPVGKGTLIRNTLLAGVAGFLVAQGPDRVGPSLLDWLGGVAAPAPVILAVAVVALALLIAEGWVLLELVRQNGRLVLRLESLERMVVAEGVAPAAAMAEPAPAPEPGLPIGAPAPAFSLTGLYGEMLTLDFLRASGKPVLLLFMDPNCGPCNALLPEIGRWQRDHAGTLAIAAITRGTPEANRPKTAEHGLTHVLLQQDREVAAAYQADATPSAVVVRRDGTIGSPVMAGVDAIRSLIARTMGEPAPTAVVTPTHVPTAHAHAANGTAAAPVVPPGRPNVGDPAPTIREPDLSGRMVDVADFRGSKTMILFWDSTCGFCQQMLNDLKAWEANPPPGAPRLLVVARGDEAANRAIGVRSPVIYDPAMKIFSAFATWGTPTAVMIDEHGRVGSNVVEGGPTVLALAGAPASNGLAAAPAPPVGPKLGEPAPSVSLPDLNGKTVELGRFRGNKVLVLFWNPGCGFCQQMLNDLKAWEVNPPDAAPKLLVVSTGTVEANRALGLRSPVVLDQTFSSGAAFGANGTPSAVLVDARGRIASDLAVGAPAVLALAGAQQGQARSASA